MRKTLAIIIAMMLVSVSFASADLLGQGGKAPAQTAASAPIGRGGTPLAAAPGVLPQAQQPNAYLWRGPGTQYRVYGSKDDKPAETDFRFTGSYTLTNENIALIKRDTSGDFAPNRELVSIANNKVVFKNDAGMLDLSAGKQTIYSWTGPDKFAYDTANNQLLFDSRPIEFEGTLQTYFLDAQKQPIPDSYVRQLENGGLLRSDADSKTITIYDQQGKTINTFTQEAWAKWSDNFNAVEDANYVAAAYAIKDLGLKPEDVTVELESGKKSWTTEAGTITMNNGQVTVEKATTTESFKIENGKKQITYYETRDEKTGEIISEFNYLENLWTTNIRNKDGTYTIKEYNVQTFQPTKGKPQQYVVLGTVMSDNTPITVVKDPYTGKTQYFDAVTGKQATDAQVEKLDKDSLKTVEETGKAVEEAVTQKNENELPRELRERGVFDFVQYYQQFSGMSGWSSLIFDSEFLENWKNKVNDMFCKTVILGGIDCWASKICGAYSDITPSRDGILYSTPVGGSPRAVAHIEAQKSMPIISPEQTTWVYTVTFGLTNPNEDAISYNVVFSGERQASWWSTAQGLGKGGTASAVGASALIKASQYAYSEVCLTLSPSIESFNGKSVSKICNDITQYAGRATAPYSAITTTNTSGTTPSAPAGPASGVNI